MLELCEWIEKVNVPERPWLILGKGPTFGRRGEFELSSFNLFSLNHVVSVLPVDVAHAIDIDVIEDCAEELEANAPWVLMPRIPHVHGRAGLARLEDYFEVIPVLGRLSRAQRLVWYNAATSAPVSESPVIDVKNFSSEAAVAILGEMGASTIRTLGIDGGQSYSAAFQGAGHTLLANGRLSFDVQFDAMDELARKYGIDLQPLVPPLRIYVGASDRDRVAVQVLEYSIRKHATIPVRVIPMIDVLTPRPRRAENRARTGFSFARFLIPSLAGYRGRAVYLDSDMLVLGDVAELAELEFAGHSILCTSQPEPPPAWRQHEAFKPGRQFSVMVLDCDALRWDINCIVADLDAERLTYEDLVFGLNVVTPEDIADCVPPEWNHLERYDPGSTKLVHFTVVPTQPWKDASNPLTDLWDANYREAVRAGFVDPETVRRLVASGELREDLLDALETAPQRGYRPSSAAEVALAAAWEYIDALEARRINQRLYRATSALRPYLSRAKGRWRAFHQAVGAVMEAASSSLPKHGMLRGPRGRA